MAKNQQDCFYVTFELLGLKPYKPHLGILLDQPMLHHILHHIQALLCLHLEVFCEPVLVHCPALTCYNPQHHGTIWWFDLIGGGSLRGATG